MRIVVAGNNLPAVLSLGLVLEIAEPADVLCLAPPGAGADRSWQASLARAAGERGVRCLQPDSPNTPEIIDHLRAFDADLLLSVYYTALFSSELLGAIGGPCVNLHPSLLPRHRGTAPLIWAIVEGDQRTGVTAHLLDEGIDTGHVVAQHPLPIHPQDTGYDLHRKAAHLVAAVVADLLRGFVRTGSFPEPRSQLGTPSYHGGRDPSVNQIRWTDPARRITDIVRALAPPLPGAFAIVGSNGSRSPRSVRPYSRPTAAGSRACYRSAVISRWYGPPTGRSRSVPSNSKTGPAFGPAARSQPWAAPMKGRSWDERSDHLR